MIERQVGASALLGTRDELGEFTQRVAIMAAGWSVDEIQRQIALLEKKPGDAAVRQATLEGLLRAYDEKVPTHHA